MSHQSAKIRLIVCIPLAVVTVLVVLVMLYMPRIKSYMDEKTLAVVLVQADERLNGEFTVGNVHWHFFPLRLELKDVRLTPPPESGIGSVDLPHVSVRLRMIKLLRGEPVVSRISIHDYSMDATLAELNKASLEQALAGIIKKSEKPSVEPSNGAAAILAPSRIELLHGVLALHIPSKDLSVKLKSANIIFRLQDGVELDVSVPRAEVRYKGDAKEIRGLALSLTHGAEGLLIDELSATVNGIALNIKGRVNGGESRSLALNLESSGPVDAYAALLGKKIPLKGEVKIDVGITGSPDDLKIQGRLESPGVRTSSLQIDNISALFGYGEGTLKFKSLSASLWGGSVEGEGNLLFSGESVIHTAGSYKLQGIDLSEVERTTGRSLPVTGKIREALVTIEGDSFSKGRLNISAEIDASIDDLRLTASHFSKSESQEKGGLFLGSSSLSGSFTLSHEKLSISRFTLSSEILSAAVSGSYGFSGPVDIDYNAEIFDLYAFKALHRQDLEGWARIVGKVQREGYKEPGLDKKSVFSGEFTTRSLVWRGLPLGEAKGLFAYHRKALTLKSIQVNGTLLAVNAGGIFNFDERFSFRLDGDAKSDSVSGLLRNLKNIFPWAETLAAKMDSRLAMDWNVGWDGGFKMEADVRLDDGVYNGEGFNTIVSLSLDGKAVKFNRAEVGFGGGEIELHGAVNYRGGISLSLSGKGVELDKLMFLKVPVKGAVDFTADLGGSLEKVKLRGFGRVEELSYRDAELPDISYKFKQDKKGLSVEAADDEGTIAFQGRFDFFGEKKYRLSYKLNGFRLTPLLSALARLPSLSGWMSATGRTEGQTGQTASTFMNVSRLQLAGAGFSWENRSPMLFTLAEGRLKVEPFQIGGGDSLFEAGGEISLAGELDFLLRGKIDLKLINYLSPQLGQITGIADVNADLKGRIKNPLLLGRARVERASFKHPSMCSPLKLEYASIDFNEREVHIEKLKAGYREGHISGRGRLIMGGGDESLQFELTFHNLSENLSCFAALPSGPEVRVNGYASVEGDYKKPGETTMQLRLFSASISSEKLVVTLREEAEISMEKGEINFPPMRFSSIRGDFTVGGLVKIDGGLDLTVEGSSPLEPLLKISGKKLNALLLSVDGALDYRLLVRGKILTPEISGRASFEIDNAFLRDLEPPVTGLRGAFLFSPSKVELVTFQGKFGEGDISGSGMLELDGLSLKSADIAVAIKDAVVERVGKFNATISADLNYLFGEQKSLLKGQVAVSEAIYYGEIDWKEAVVKQSRFIVNGDSEKVKEPLAMEMKVELESPAQIANNLMEATLEGKLSVKGSSRQPELYGSIIFTDGYVFFGDKVYSIDDAAVDFSGPVPDNISFNTALITDSHSYTITVILSGTPNRYTLQFTSDPPLEQADIISLLTLGTTIDNLDGGDTGERSAYQALKLLAFKFQGKLTKGIKQTTGLDVVEIETIGEKGKSGSSIRLGKKVTDSLSVVYSTGLENTKNYDVELAYKLSEKVYLKGMITEVGATEVGLVYRLEFK